MRRAVIFLCALFTVGACNQPAAPPAAAPAPAVKKLGIRPAGDTEIQPDLSQLPPEVQKVYAHIDENIDAHVENLQKWIRQPSISNSGEGIPESAEMVKGFFDELGCQQSQVFDVGITEYGSPGNPVVYAKCDEGAEKTVLIYWMYDTMPITQPDAWTSPPFEPEIRKGSRGQNAIFARGSSDDKGQLMTFLEASRSWLKVHGSLPFRLTVMIEGDEEGDASHIDRFLKAHAGEFPVDAVFICDTGMWDEKTPGIDTRLRGCSGIEFTVIGPKIDLHSGLYGGPVQNPIKVRNMLTHALSQGVKIFLRGHIKFDYCNLLG